MTLLDVNNLSVSFITNDGVVNAVNDISFNLDHGKTLAIVGESGSGKSQTAFATMGLLAKNGIASGSIKFEGTEILNVPQRTLNQFRATQMGIVFQDPMSSLNPYMRVSDQMSEVLMHHRGLSKSDSLRECVAMLDAVEIPDANSRIQLYPHEYSGGMRQRVMIAMSLVAKPKLLIADEPTTALDVTVQAQIMTLFKTLQKELGMALILITHDLGVVAGSCEDMLVLYGGRVMEHGPTDDVFQRPSHPYTKGLISAIPRIDNNSEKLATIKGSPPNMLNTPEGCPFAPRCEYARDLCHQELSPLTAFTADRYRACHRSIEEIL